MIKIIGLIIIIWIVYLYPWIWFALLFIGAL